MNMRPPGPRIAVSTSENVERVKQTMLRIASRSARRYFFEKNGIAVTINSSHNINMINNFLGPELRRRRIQQT